MVSRLHSDLSNNNLSTLPTELALMPNIVSLFEKFLPSTLCTPKHGSHRNIDGNTFTEFSTGFCTFTYLKSLAFENANLAEFPSCLTAFATLSYLFVGMMLSCR